MSEAVQITIENEGTFSLKKGESVFSVLIATDKVDFSHCGGHGICGHCQVLFLKGAPLPKPGDRMFFTPKQLREGYRLACLAKPVEDCVIRQIHKNENKEFILTGLGNAEFERILKNPVSQSEKESVSVSESSGERKILVTDLGTTTIAIQLVRIRDGAVIDTYSGINPQRRYGADVITRMTLAVQGLAEELQKSVQDFICKGIRYFKERDEIDDDCVMYLAGNTVMTHLFLGFSVDGLSQAPFRPYSLEPEQTKLEGMLVKVLPGLSAFVGGDIFAGIYACEKQTERRNQVRLLIDLGTNGEMALIGPDRIYCTATAAGPAFEGRSDSMLHGSRLIELASELLLQGEMDETGLLSGYPAQSGVVRNEIFISQEDIRALQMAKAAVRSGIELLCQEYPVPLADITKVYLAGGFGYRLSVLAAARIGLLPGELSVKTKAAGNTALAGAFLYGRDDLNGVAEKETEWIKKRVKTMNLAQHPDFQTLYIQEINFNSGGAD